MKTFWISVLILSPLILSQGPLCCPPVRGQTAPCTVQNYLPLTGYSVPVDPNRIAFDYTGSDPARPSPRRLLLCPPIIVGLGQTATHRGWVCDPDNDAMQLTATLGTLTINSDGTYDWSYRVMTLGPTYANLTVSDIRDSGDARSATGTLMVYARPANNPPVLGCGSRP